MSSSKLVNERITRLRERYQKEIPKISIERAKFFTEKWFELENNSDISIGERIALSMQNVFENMTHYLDKDDKIVGYWTENFLGFPIDIERGVFNDVLKNELKWLSLFSFRLKSTFKMAKYLIKTKRLKSFIRNMKIIRSMGTPPINFGIKTMAKRKINKFTINRNERKTLLKKILPKWKNKTMMDILERELYFSGLLDENMVNFMKSFPTNTSKQTMMISMCSTIVTYQGHLILDFEKVLNNGILGIQNEIKRKLNKNSNSKKEVSVLNSFKIALDGILIYINRLIKKIEENYNSEMDSVRKKELKLILENCSNVPLNPARTFYEAVQSIWLIRVVTELVHPVNTHALGRLDQMLYPFYKNDIEKGIISPDEARELLAELLLKIMSLNIRPESNTLGNFYHRYVGTSPVTIGGLKSNNIDGTNQLTNLILEAAELSRAVTNISLRISKHTPDEIIISASELLSKGSSNIAFYNDEINIEAMKRRSFIDEDARDYGIMGCVEMIGPGKTGGMSPNALLLCRLLDITMRNGNAQTLIGIMEGNNLKTGAPEYFSKYNDFEEALITQGKKQIELITKASNLRDKLYAEYLPAPFISIFIEGCIDKIKDVTQGGGIYDLSGISFINSIANMTDSLYIIKKLIFEEKVFTFNELIEAIDNNYVGYEEIHRKIMKIQGKWGNGYKPVDNLARRITTRLFKETYNYRTYRGGVFVPYVISMTTHTIDGRISIATPDGRRAARPYAASCNPYNVEKNGLTSVLSSVASLDYEHVMGCAVNIKVHPTAIGQRIENHKKWVALIRTYFDLGGAQLQPTVASNDMLLDAQNNPHKYSGLLVKVGGYSAYFTELGIEIQNEIIARTEH